MAKLQKTEDDIRDEEMRANPMGLFNTACSYHVAARELDKLNLRTTHREMPVYLLYFHSIELFLKSLLRTKYSVATLKARTFGHDIPVLAAKAKEMGLIIPKADMASLTLSDLEIVFGARYIRTGFNRLPKTEHLLAICGRLRKRIGSKLRKQGIAVRK